MIKGIDYHTKMYFKSLFSVTLWVVRFHIGQPAATSMTVIFFYTYSLVVSFPNLKTRPLSNWSIASLVDWNDKNICGIRLRFTILFMSNWSRRRRRESKSNFSYRLTNKFQTLKRKCITSPSWTIYSLPSTLILPACFTICSLPKSE